MGEAVVRLPEVAYYCRSFLDVVPYDGKECFPGPVCNDLEEAFTTASFDASKDPLSFDLKHIAPMSECREKKRKLFLPDVHDCTCACRICFRRIRRSFPAPLSSASVVRRRRCTPLGKRNTNRRLSCARGVQRLAWRGFEGAVARRGK